MLAMVAMVLWLIISNALWDSPKRANLARVVLLYNLSTVMTLVVCVLGLYLAPAGARALRAALGVA